MSLVMRVVTGFWLLAVSRTITFIVKVISLTSNKKQTHSNQKLSLICNQNTKKEDTMVNKKLQVWLPLVFSIVLIGGMYFGFELRDNSPSGKSFFRPDKKSTLQEILDLVKLRYVDPVRTDTLQYKAINEMMGQLDPHSVFIPASELQEVNEDLTGNFEGIGVEFNIFYDTVHVVHVLVNGPSDKAGVQVGDRIIKVNDVTIAGKAISSDDVKKKIRGERGSVVKITVLRSSSLKDISITRGTIPLPALDAAYLLDKNTGYIRLNKFSETSYEEFMQALEDLQKQQITKLVLDLRGNGGGLMNEAVDITDEFLSDDKLVVYTEGLNVKRREYRCKRPGLFETGDLAVLVDELSASASEVLAGALQDWCRATIIGRRTFGKGLVQEQYSLSDGSALRLTVARYYTPKGRSIQRAYDKGKEKYLEEIVDRYENGEAVHLDTSKVANGKIYKTVCGDSVYGGGGITPKIFVSLDTGRLHSNVSRLYISGLLNNFYYNYYILRRQEINKYNSASEFNSRYNNMEDAWNSLVTAALKDSIDLNKVSEADKNYLKKRIKAQLARYRWRTEGYYEVLNSSDPVIKKALEVLSK
jgi:carboxyl-terminal processing protease